MVRFPGAERWYARSSDGVWNSPHFVWHPSYDVVHSEAYHTMRHGALRWRNLYHPFGIGGVQAEVGAIAGDRSLSVKGFSDGAKVYVWDRVESNQTLAVGISGDNLQDLSCRVVPSLSKEVTRNDGPDTGDRRLKVMIGGYEFEEKGFRVRIDRRGMARGVWVRRDGSWAKQPLASYLDSKILQTPARDSSKVDCCHRFSRGCDGRLKVDFYDGCFKDNASSNRTYRVTYVLGGEKKMAVSHDF